LATDPDEIWVIQINAKKTDTEPRTVVEIADRRNELSGNLSLYQELHFIEKIDTMLDDGLLAPGKYRPITIRIIEMSRSSKSMTMGAASKINRDPAFVNELIGQGDARTTDFINALDFERSWLARDAETIIGHFAQDAEVSSSAPFKTRAPRRGPAAVREFVVDALAATVTADFTRKQLSGDWVRWRVRTPGGDNGGYRVGIAQARFVKGRITDFRLASA
jgi:NTE family protein